MTQIISQNNWWWSGGWASYTAWTWIDITSNVISVDEDVVQTVANMVDNLTWADDDHYPTAKAVADAISWGWLWDVIWPASSTDWDIVLFDWTSGKIIKDSWALLSSKLDASALSDVNYWWAWNGDTTHTPTKNVLYTKIHTMDVEIGNKAADTTVVKLSWNQTINWTKTFWTSPVVPSKTTDATNTWTAIATEAQVYTVADAVSTINWKISSDASSSNKLMDKNYIDDSINSVTAYYITKNAQGDQWATYAELAAASTFYSWGVARTPTRNDYTIVLADENHDNATTRYIYNSGWEYQYTVNETALTQSQLDALNSGITSWKVSTYDWYATTISGKQDALTLPATPTQWNLVVWGANNKSLADGGAVPTNKAAASGWVDVSLVTTWDKYNWDNKQDALTTQTAYTTQWSATTVPQITTNTLGQVTGITEVTITHPSQVDDTAYAASWDWVTTTAPSKNAVYDKISSMDTTIGWKQDKATSGSTAPSSTPSYIGQVYVDTTNSKMYVAVWTSSSSDWFEVWSGSWVQISSQANNVFSSWAKLRWWTEANYSSLGSYSNDTVYLTY